MNYQIVIDPDLKIDPTALAKAWNDDPQTQTIASATTEQPDSAVAYPIPIDPEAAQYGMMMVLTFVGGMVIVEEEDGA